MNKFHQELLEEIKAAGDGESHTAQGSNYTGSTHIGYGVSVPVHRKIVKDWIKKHPDLTLDEYVDLLNSLAKGESMDEKVTVGKLLEYLPKLRSQLDPILVDSWLDELTGWAEIDSLCQSNFTEKDLLNNWDTWEDLIRKFSEDISISKRRASLVLLIRAVGRNSDERLSNLAFENIEKLKSEKNILITKAISWLLRVLIKFHREEVERYIEDKGDTLPAIAVRETRIKLETGKKTNRSNKTKILS